MTLAYEIRPVDLTDPGQLLAWNEVLRRGYDTGREAAWWRSDEATLGQYLQPKPGRTYVALWAFDGGAAVGGVEASVDEGKPANVEVAVVAAHRRRGLGARLAAETRRRLRGAATVMQAETYCDAGVAFGKSLGMRVGNEEFRQLLPLPVLPDGRAEPPVPAELAIHCWTGRCPDHLVADLALLTRQMDEDVPMGSLTRVVSTTDVEAVRRGEARSAAQGYLLVRAMATLGGEAVGYTEIYLPTAAPEIVIQDDTLVHRAHRGKGIGRALKLANLRQLAALPQAASSRWVQTYTATTNTAMLALNASLGFRVADTMTALEGPI